MTTRRTFLAASAGILVAGRASAAEASRLVTGPVPARRSGPPGPDTLTGRTPFPLSHVGIRWSGHGQPVVRLRPGPGGGDWRPVHACLGRKDGASPWAGWAVLVLPGPAGYQIRLSGAAGELSATELSTAGPPAAAAAAAASVLSIDGHEADVTYLSRAGWGADESLRFRPDGTQIWPPAYFPVQTLTVHHTATANNDPDPAATVRAIYYYHAVTLGYGDIGYHLLIDQAGTVYEGRWSDACPVPVFGTTPGPDGRPQMVDAGHVLGFNAGNVGVALLGDFTSLLPAPAALKSLTAVLALLAGVTALNPVGTTNYVNPISGAAKTVPTIAGHRDWQPTLCPGGDFYPRLPSLRQNVARMLGT